MEGLFDKRGFGNSVRDETPLGIHPSTKIVNPRMVRFLLGKFDLLTFIKSFPS